MKFFRSTSAAASFLIQDANGSVVTIGNFDGVHIGHQAMLKAAREHADQAGLAFNRAELSILIRKLISPQILAPRRLSSLGERVVMLQKMGVNIACILPFDADLAAIKHRRLCRAGIVRTAQSAIASLSAMIFTMVPGAEETVPV